MCISIYCTYFTLLHLAIVYIGFRETTFVTYYDQECLTIHHIDCPKILPTSLTGKCRCHQEKYRDNVLRSSMAQTKAATVLLKLVVMLTFATLTSQKRSSAYVTIVEYKLTQQHTMISLPLWARSLMWIAILSFLFSGSSLKLFTEEH